MNTPEELFRQYMSLIPDLPDNTTRCKMQPDHASFDALNEVIWDILAYHLYTHPILSHRPKIYIIHYSTPFIL